MMYKWLIVLLLLGILIAPTQAQAENAVLVITDGDDENVLFRVGQALLYSGVDFQVVPLSPDMDLSGYSRVILLLSKNSSPSLEVFSAMQGSQLPILVIGSQGSFPDGLERIQGNMALEYTFLSGAKKTWTTGQSSIYGWPAGEAVPGGTLHSATGETYPLCARKENITFLSYFDPGDEAMHAMLSELISLWMWPYSSRPPRHGSYLVLEEVYPFEDLVLLLQMGNALALQGISYAIEVMPVARNAEYPAMKRFCEVLSYLQSKGAAIVMHVPLNGLQALSVEQLQNAIRASYEAYIQYGVYPLALSAPADYLWSEAGAAAMRGIQIVLLHPVETRGSIEENAAYADGHLLIVPANERGEVLTDVYATAVYVSIHEVDSEGLTHISAIENSLFKSLWDIEPTLYIGQNSFFSLGGKVVYNQEEVSLAYHPFVYEDHIYDHGFSRFLTEPFQQSNRVLIIFVASASLVYLLIISVTRRHMKRRFFISGKHKGGDASHDHT